MNNEQPAKLGCFCLRHLSRVDDYVFLVRHEAQDGAYLAIMPGKYVTAPAYLAQQGKLVRVVPGDGPVLTAKFKEHGYIVPVVGDLGLLNPDTIDPGDEATWDAYLNAISASEMLLQEDPFSGDIGDIGNWLETLEPRY